MQRKEGAVPEKCNRFGGFAGRSGFGGPDESCGPDARHSSGLELGGKAGLGSSRSPVHFGRGDESELRQRPPRGASAVVSMAEEVVFGDFEAPAAAGYESRVVRTAFVGDSKDKLFFRVYFINLVGHKEWANSAAGHAQQDEMLKNVADRVPNGGAVGFAVCFPHTCKIYQFDPQQETRLCGRSFDPSKNFAVRTARLWPGRRTQLVSFVICLCSPVTTARRGAGGFADARDRDGRGLRCRGADRGG
jgi:hypothetical protein